MDPLRGQYALGAHGAMPPATQNPNGTAPGLQELLAAAVRNPAFNQMAPVAATQGLTYQDVLAQMQQMPQQIQPQYANLLQMLSDTPGLNMMGVPPLAGMQQQDQSRGGGRARPSRSTDTRGTNNTSYASRHQQAEARRRSRINERLDALRKLVPHTERANTAVFLEDVVKYVQRMQHRILELETKLGLPPTVVPQPAVIAFGDAATPEATAITSNSAGIDRLALHAVLQQAAATVAGMPPMVPGMLGQATAPAQLVPVLPSTSEELAMVAQLAKPPKEGPLGATMAESMPVGGDEGPKDPPAATTAGGGDGGGGGGGDAAGGESNPAPAVELAKEESPVERKRRRGS